MQLAIPQIKTIKATAKPQIIKKIADNKLNIVPDKINAIELIIPLKHFHILGP